MMTWLIYHYKDTIFVESAAIKYSKQDRYTWDCWELAKAFPFQFYSNQDVYKSHSNTKADPKRHCTLIPTKIEFDHSLTAKGIQMWFNCFPSYKFCDTHNSLSPVIFAIEIHEKVTLFKVGYASDGVFDVTTMFNEINWGLMNNDYTVSFAALPHFYDATYNKKIAEDLDKNKYSLPLGYRWTKAQTCASCREQSLTINRGYSEMQTKAQALQTAWTLSVTGSASTTLGFSGLVDAGLVFNLGYGASKNGLNRRTFTDSLTLGTDVTKTISCNSRNIYIYGLSITLWNGKTETMPTDYYYCSDREAKPICIPKITGDEESAEQTRYCNGGDAEYDFNAKIKEAPKITNSAKSGTYLDCIYHIFMFIQDYFCKHI